MGLNIDLNLGEESIDTEEHVDFEEIDDREERVDFGELGDREDDDRDAFKEDEKNLEPTIDMEFDSAENAHLFYTKYGKRIGFGVAKIACRRSKASGEWIDVKFACTRHGTKRESNAVNPRPCLKMNCKAVLHVKRRQDCKWVVYNFIKEHNHELNPDYARYFPCHRRISAIDKHNIKTLHAVGVKTTKIVAAIAKQHGGYQNLGFLEKDVRNLLDKEKRLELESGDAKEMLEHFTRMQEENSNFFYAMDLDEEQRLRNVFWVDAKGRDDYKIFGDVVSFDTTYITNKYKMPFAPFIGVNNHFQSTLLGCALLANENTSSFEWLMRTWVRAMGGRAPTAILTDQDKAMKAAIKIVFPNTRHRFCLWHILRKVPDNLGDFIKKHEDFMVVFNNCIYHSWTGYEFENKWQNMLKKYELHGNEWLSDLYKDRELWVPTYMRDTFFAGMSTTQRSESINSFFDKYVNKKTSLKEFVEQYKLALQDRQEAETHANFNTWQKNPVLKSPSPFEKQMSVVYTHEVFKKFQVEVLGASACYCIKQDMNDMTITFSVQDFEKKENFIVVSDGRTGEVFCLCHHFEYNGFLCRHAMAVLQSFGIFNIPSQYILKRWSKDARTESKTGNVSKEVNPRDQRFNYLFQKVYMLTELGSLTEENFDIVNHAMDEALKLCKESKSKKDDIQDVNKENINTNVLCDITVLDPKVSKTKGAPKRIKAGIEKSKKKYNKKPKNVQMNLTMPSGGMESSSQRMGHTTHWNGSFDNNCNTQGLMQYMVQPNLEVQNSLKKMDQHSLRVLAPLSNYYGMEENMQWMESPSFFTSKTHG